MNIEWVIPCRHVEVHDNLATIVGGGIDTITVPHLPAPVVVALAVRFVAMPEELSEDVTHLATNRVFAPDGTLLGELGGELTIAGEASRPDWLVGVVVPTIVQFQATVEGTYQLEVQVNDASRQQPLHVIVQRPA